MNQEKEKQIPEHCPLNEDNMETENRRRWHIGREIPIAIIIILLAQTGGVVWWAASTTANVAYMKEASIAAQIVQTAVDRRQDDDAQRSETRILVQLDQINIKLDRLSERISRVRP